MSDAGVTVRRAGPGDLVTLRRFEQGIIAAERPFDPTIKKGEVHYYDIGALIASTDAFVAIAEAAGEPIGCGLARKKASPVYTDPSFHAYIGLMFVDPAYRGKGVSDAIISRLTDWAKAAGLSEIRLEVYPDNASAVRAYVKAGFAPYMLEMRRGVGE
ncbi:MAG: GNAT family N-acetyltransferase [Pseudomonadota bacterium]